MKKFILMALVVIMSVAAVFGIVACNKTTEKLVGYDIDLARAVGEYLGVEVEFQEIKWANKEFELSSKNIDLLWNGMTINDERIAAWEISEEYMLNKQVAIIRKSDASKYDTLEKMKTSQKWVAESGSAGEDIIVALGRTPIKADAQINILTELKSGTADIGVMDKVMAGYYMKSGSNYSSDLMIADVEVSDEDEYYGIACRKGEVALMDKVNTALAALQANGTIKKIATEYGVDDAILPINYTSNWDNISDKSSWDYITGKGKIVIGYTLFAPIAFKVNA